MSHLRGDRESHLKSFSVIIQGACNTVFIRHRETDLCDLSTSGLLGSFNSRKRFPKTLMQNTVTKSMLIKSKRFEQL